MSSAGVNSVFSAIITTMIDIHSHILPGFDDGPRSFESSMLLTKQIASEDTSIVFATPHLSHEAQYVNAPRILEAVIALQEAMDRAGESIRILPGAEVFPAGNVLDYLDKGLPITLGESGKYILMDMPLMTMPLELEFLVYELQTRGITPILAHPERSLPIQQDIQILEKPVHMGLLIQINAASIVGCNGKSAAATASRLLAQNWVHFVASDAHSVRRRPSELSKARTMMSDLLDESRVTELFVENGRRVVSGDIVLSNPGSFASRRAGGLAGRLLSLFRPRNNAL